MSTTREFYFHLGPKRYKDQRDPIIGNMGYGGGAFGRLRHKSYIYMDGRERLLDPPTPIKSVQNFQSKFSKIFLGVGSEVRIHIRPNM